MHVIHQVSLVASALTTALAITSAVPTNATILPQSTKTFPAAPSPSPPGLFAWVVFCDINAYKECVASDGFNCRAKLQKFEGTECPYAALIEYVLN